MLGEAILGALSPAGEYAGRAPAEAFRQLHEHKCREKATERREWQEAARMGIASYDRAKAATRTDNHTEGNDDG